MLSSAANAAKFALNNGPSIFFLVQNTANCVNNFRDWIYKKFEHNNQCPVCNQQIFDNEIHLDNTRVKLPVCGHSYHLRCLNYMREIQSICAICERDIIPDSPELLDSVSDGSEPNNNNLNIN